MTITRYTFDDKVNNTNVVVGDGITEVSASAPKYQDFAAFHSVGLGINTVGQQWFKMNAPATDFSASLYARCAVNPGSSSQRFMLLRTAADAIAGSIRFHSSGVIHIANAAGTLVGSASTTTWTTSSVFRFDMQFDAVGADTAVILRIFKDANIDGTTPDETMSRTLTGVNVSAVRFGGNDAGTWDLRLDSIALSDALEWIGPYEPITPLPTPVVTVTDETGPSTPTAEDGSITITWPSVSGADHYDAGILTGNGHTTGFVIDSTSATSPHTFTGLGAGPYSVAIRAMPEA